MQHTVQNHKKHSGSSEFVSFCFQFGGKSSDNIFWKEMLWIFPFWKIMFRTTLPKCTTAPSNLSILHRRNTTSTIKLYFPFMTIYLFWRVQYISSRFCDVVIQVIFDIYSICWFGWLRMSYISLGEMIYGKIFFKIVAFSILHSPINKITKYKLQF